MDLDLYMEARDVGATHEEVLDGLGALVPDVIPPADSSRARPPSMREEVVIRVWLEGYRIARRAGATHLEAQELYHRAYPPDRYAHLRAGLRFVSPPVLLLAMEARRAGSG